MLLLHLLQEDDLYGYQLSQLIKQRTNNILTIPEGSMYPTLYRLLERGFISDEKRQVGKRLIRVYYHLEPEGQKYLQELLHDYNRVNEGIQLLLTFNTSEENTNDE